ncbi:MAG: hypothetical protein JWO25_3586, partial [Alphaproteobacteria bacterium]|nr:hypothetical protein [Alphaproteobacteria bacterium]
AATEMTFPVRCPNIDYAQVEPHWSPNIAFAQDRNAASTIPTPVEPWLIKVLQTALGQLQEADVQLREEVLAFIGQESQHFRQHRQFNKMMIAAGYPRIAEFEKELAADLDDFLKTRSLKFHLAYADGFESLGAVSGVSWFEKSDRFIGGLDNPGVTLWKWHTAEEFEHREVCFKFYHALFGRGLWNAIVNGYFYRVYGLYYAMTHLGRYSKKVTAYLLDIDRASMDAAQRAELERDIKAFKRFQLRHFLPQLLKNLLPWYNPGRKRIPRGLFEYLRQFEPGGKLAR